MTSYRLEIRITPRDGLLDPQGRAVEAALTSLGIPGVDGVRVGKLVRLVVDAATEEEAVDRAREMCEKLVANPITEDYDVRVLGSADGEAPRG